MVLSVASSSQREKEEHQRIMDDTSAISPRERWGVVSKPSGPNLDMVVVILDWDDTLIASTFIAGTISVRSSMAPTMSEMKLLEQQERASIAFLNHIMQAGGSPYIVTNANARWVDYTNRLYPRLSAFIKERGITIQVRESTWCMHMPATSRASDQLEP
jgi:hypothetical protein